jgi:RNA-directed DNA polymerase
VVSAKTFQSVAHAIFQALWRWAKRRHPTTGARWVKARYFRFTDPRSWGFSGDGRGAEGLPPTVRLYATHGVHLKRHAKIKRTVHPYAPRWESHLEERLGRKMAAALAGRPPLLYLWKRQNGRGLHGGEAITTVTGWQNHHTVWRSHGGSDAAA